MAPGGDQPDAGPSALVTGASSGIGRAIATALADDGYAVTAASRRADRLEPVATELRRRGRPVTAVSTDVTSDDDLHALVAAHAASSDGLDVLVHSAGGGILGSLDETTGKHIDRQLAVNLRAPIVLTKLALPLLRAAVAARGRAVVVHVSSYAGKVGREHLTVYSAAKHGIVGFSAACNRELSAEGIHSVTLCPTVVDTPLTEPFADRIPRHEMIAADDLTAAVRFVLHTSAHCVIPEIPLLRRGASPFE